MGSTAHFITDPNDISILPPVIFPIKLTPDTLTSLPMVLLNDSFTLIQPNINLKTLKSGKCILECLIRLNGAVSGLPDMSVFRQADYFRHVSDIQARVVLHYISSKGWSKQELDLTQGGVMIFRGIDIQMVQDVLTEDQVFRGYLVVRQFRGQDDRFNSSELKRGDFEEDGSESEPEGEDLGHDDDEEEEEDDDDEDGEDLNDFIEDEAEVSGEEEEALEDDDQNKKNSSASESGEDSDGDKKDQEEPAFSSDEEAVKNPRYQNKKRKTQQDLSSEDEGSRKKKRKRLVVQSDSDEEEEMSVGNKKSNKNLDSESGGSEYETDSEMGDDVKEQLDNNDEGTPEACFSGEEDNAAEDAQFSDEDNGTNEENDPDDDCQFSDKDDDENEDDNLKDDAQFSEEGESPTVEGNKAEAYDSDHSGEEDSIDSEQTQVLDEKEKLKNIIENEDSSEFGKDVPANSKESADIVKSVESEGDSEKQ